MANVHVSAAPSKIKLLSMNNRRLRIGGYFILQKVITSTTKVAKATAKDKASYTVMIAPPPFLRPGNRPSANLRLYYNIKGGIPKGRAAFFYSL